MTAKDVIRDTTNMAHAVTKDLLKDLSDADLLLRPVPAMNHIAWQLGHLIVAENSFMTMLGHAMPELPAGFKEAHAKEMATSNDATKFAKKDVYLALMGKQHEATLKHLAATADADLDKPGPEPVRSYAPTVGSLFALIGSHEWMHQGQFVAVRRALGKPVVM